MKTGAASLHTFELHCDSGRSLSVCDATLIPDQSSLTGTGEWAFSKMKLAKKLPEIAIVPGQTGPHCNSLH
ncbi:hypothetical protein GJAV_G00086900 [Gymnothorax javanicus]|nr:hypothetical protein GJAV_G00086900 [Gymnothorax javanicus]